MKLTVIICTWNRARYLQRTLESLTRLAVPDGVSWDLLVVNNNSSDDTDAVVASFATLLPVRGLTEPRQGKSFALNTAVAQASGEWLLFTDDDVILDPDWLAAYHRAFLRWPETGFFGGPIRLRFEVPPPEWLQRTLHLIGYCYAALDLGPDPGVLEGSDLPFGANMAVRADLHRSHLYDTRIGVTEGRRLAAEETWLMRSLRAAGAEGRWVPDARLEHIIEEARVSVRYVERWFNGMGQTIALRSGNPGRLRLLGRPAWLWRDLLVSFPRYWVRRLVAQPERWIRDLEFAHRSAGRFSIVSDPVGPTIP